MFRQPRLLMVTVLLILGVTALAAVAYAQDSSPIYLPLIQGGGGNTEETDAAQTHGTAPTPPYKVHPDDVHLLEKLEDLPYYETPPPDAITLRPADVFSRPIPAATMEALHNEISLTVQPVSGPETAGSKIDLAERSLQLPPDFYIYAYISNISCDTIQLEDGSWGTYGYCPAPPLYVVAKLGVDPNEQLIRIERNGDVFTPNTSADRAEQISLTFKPVLDALDKMLIVDPPADTIIPATTEHH